MNKQITEKQYKDVLMSSLDDIMQAKLAELERVALDEAVEAFIKKYPKPIFNKVNPLDFKGSCYNMILVGEADYTAAGGTALPGYDNFKLVGDMPFYKVKSFKKGKCTPIFTWAFPKLDVLANGRVEAPEFIFSFMPIRLDDTKLADSLNDAFYAKRGK